MRVPQYKSARVSAAGKYTLHSAVWSVAAARQQQMTGQSGGPGGRKLLLLCAGKGHGAGGEMTRNQARQGRADTIEFFFSNVLPLFSNPPQLFSKPPVNFF